jgi:drug/metabolite transporter (DMT)-like permease
MRWIKLFGVLTLWALSFILNEVALSSLGPAVVVAGRWTVTALLVLGLMAWRRELGALWTALRREFMGFLALAVVGIALLYGLQVAGQSLTSAINTGLLANMVGVFTALLARVFLHERLPRAAWAGILVALLGAWVVSTGGLRMQVQVESALGDLLVLTSSFVAALYFIMGKRLVSRHSPMIVTAASATLGALTLLPVAALETNWHAAAISLPSALAVAALGIGPGLLANLWWWQTAQWLDASRAAIYVYLIPLITMAFAVIFLHEPLSLAQVAGAALVLFGVWLAERSRMAAAPIEARPATVGE